MKISDEILEAVERASDHYGNISQLAKIMGVAHSTILFWRSKKTTNMSGKLWIEKIKPVLAPFLSDAKLVLRDPSVGSYASPTLPAFPPQGTKAFPPKGSINHATYCISVSKFVDFDPAIESVSCFVRTRSHERHTFYHECKRGSFCFQIDKMLQHIFPLGSSILAYPSHPVNGGAILGKLNKSGKIIVRKYFRNGSIINLTPFPGDPEPEITWNCTEEHGVLLWSYPLIEMNLSFSFTEEEEEGV